MSSRLSTFMVGTIHRTARGDEVHRPYQEGIVDSMMICHGWYPCFEPTTHAGHRVAPDCYRVVAHEFGFEGLIMTDDLDMGAILTGLSIGRNHSPLPRGRKRHNDALSSRA